MPNRNEEDIRNPSRVFFRLISDYSHGRLTKHSIKLYRARVEAVDSQGGQLENNPPNPPNSIRARIYTSGLDLNIPSVALSIFHPLFPPHVAVPVDVNEHVWVIFEDENFTHGLWISTVSSYSNLNFSNPDERQNNSRNSSHSFEGDSPNQSIINPNYEYGGASLQTEGRQEMVDNFEVSSHVNFWQNKKIIHIGDSQVGGAVLANGQRTPQSALSHTLELKLRELQCQSYMALGRVGWGVFNWNNGTTNGALHGLSLPQPSITQLAQQNRPDVILITLGGNDGASRAAIRSDYVDAVRQLYSEATRAAPLVFWCGPPTAIGNSSAIQPNREVANEKIRSVVGSNFIDCRAITNTTRGRDARGVHFTLQCPILSEWANLYLNKGNQS